MYLILNSKLLNNKRFVLNIFQQKNSSFKNYFHFITKSQINGFYEQLRREPSRLLLSTGSNNNVSNHNIQLSNDLRSVKKYYSTSPTNDGYNGIGKNKDEQQRYLTIPNVLTCARICSTPVISYMMIAQMHDYAFYLFLCASITDFVDGYIARNFKNQQSYIGSVLDPFADKFLIGTLTVTLGYCGLLPIWFITVVLGRDIGLLAGTFYMKKKTNTKSLKDINIKPNFISKFNTVLQLSLITLTIPSELYAYSGSALLISLQYLTAFTTVTSGLSYVRKHGFNKISS